MQAKESKLGGTPLIHAKKLGDFLKVDRLYVKYEGTNPTGTQKDRPASLHVRKALEEKYDTIVVGSCGNYGAAIAHYASLSGLKSRIYVPKEFHSPRLEEIKRMHGAELILVPGKYEDSVEMSKKDAKENNWFDANAGAYPDLGLLAYSRISIELFESMGEIPDAVSVPVGNGTTLAGVYKGFFALRESNRTKKLPRIIAASTDGGNPVIESFIMGQKEITDFPVERIKETEINEPLVNYRSYDGGLAFKAVLDSGGTAEYVTDEELSEYHTLLKKYERIDAIPAATASIAAIAHFVKKNKNGTFVAIVTG